MEVYVVYSVDNFDGYDRTTLLGVAKSAEVADKILADDRAELVKSWGNSGFIDKYGNFDTGSDYCEWFIEEQEVKE